MDQSDRTSHLTAEEWDQWLVGAPTERSSAHLEACVECRSVAERLSLDESPVTVLRGYSGHRRVRSPWTLAATALFGIVAAVAALWYGAAFLRVQEREVALSARVLELEGQLGSVKTDPGTRVPADSVPSSELVALKDTLARLQREAFSVAAHRREDQALRAQLRALEQQNEGDRAALEQVRSEYEAKLKKNDELLSSLRSQLSATQLQLTAALQAPSSTPTQTAADVSQHLNAYADASGLDRVVLTSKDQTHHGNQVGVIVVTADSSQLEEIQKLLARDGSGSGKIYFVVPKSSLNKCKGAAEGCVTVDFTKEPTQ